MKEYYKINSVYKRDERGNFTEEYSTPEFEYLANNQWTGTEKIDGTNIRIMWHFKEKAVKIGGKTDNAQIPVFLYDKLQTMFAIDKFEKYFPETDVCFYGEGYGSRIQKGGGNYIPDGVSFILFDVLIGSFWLKKEDIDDLANKFGIKSVPVVFQGTLPEAIEFVKEGFNSVTGNCKAEGLVLVPQCQLFNRIGSRIVTKIKFKDFIKKEK